MRDFIRANMDLFVKYQPELAEQIKGTPLEGMDERTIEMIRASAQISLEEWLIDGDSGEV